MSEPRGRPRKYARLIESIKTSDGWVPVCEQKARTAAPGFAQRYPGFRFRSVVNPGPGKEFILEARRMEDGE